MLRDKDSVWRKIILPALAACVSVVTSLLLFELAYRFQVVDFYSAELVTFNPKADLFQPDKRPALLFFGDSFTAGNECYANILRSKLPGLRVINSSIPGSGILQTSYIARSRLHRFNPSFLIYQIYIGNDLFDISYPINWRQLSLLRNLYWSLTNHLRSLAFLNYRLGQAHHDIVKRGYQSYSVGNSSFQTDEIFSPGTFLNNEPLILKADPRLIEKQVLLLEERKKDFSTLVTRLKYVLSQRAADCSCYLLVLPHASQVSKAYLDRSKRLGAIFDHEDLILSPDSVFVRELRRAFPECVTLDPLKLFQSKEQEGIPLFWPNDIHLNPNGNKILAEYLAGILRQAAIPR
jgi:hypothetical protein